MALWVVPSRGPAKWRALAHTNRFVPTLGAGRRLAGRFFVSRLHRWTTRKAARPKIDLLYLAAAHACLAAR
jgi:hypothetical protein